MTDHPDSPAAPAAPLAGARRFAGPVLAAVAIGLAVASLAWSPLSLAALLVLVPAAAELRGRAAIAVAVGGGLLLIAAVGRFVVGTAMPSLVGMGRHTTSEHAVSELRAILWAQDRAIEERAGKGMPVRYAFLHELVDGVGEVPVGVSPPLDPRRLVPVDGPDRRPTTFRAGGYLVRVFLPARAGGGVASGEGDVDPDLGGRAWVAYAWPERPEAGSRAIFLAEDETICISDGPGGYVGLAHAPDAVAALGGPRLDSPRCGRGQDGGTWRPWRNKKPRRK